MNAAAGMIVLLLLGGAAHADQCPQPETDPGAEMLRPLDTPEFREQLRRGHAWRETTGDVGEYFSRLIAAIMTHQQQSVATLLAAGFDQSRSHTRNGLTVLELARKLKDPCIEELLSN